MANAYLGACDLCGMGAVHRAPTGTLYCAAHRPGEIIPPDEYARYSIGQQQRREEANESVSNNPPGGLPGQRV